MTGYDIIGDIHGYYDELLLLILKLGYYMEGEIYVHKEDRNIVFVGDLIDRGPKIRETLQLVKLLVDTGLAYCVKGNHEYNAINFWEISNTDGEYYRKHTRQNIIQHYKTIESFQNRDEEWLEYIAWMNQLPIILDMGDFRVVHASYHPLIDELMKEVSKISSTYEKQNMLTTDLGRSKTKEGWKIKDVYVYDIIECTLKGSDVPLPEGLYFYDKEGTKRIKSRTKWWLSPINNTYDKYLADHAAGANELRNMKVDIDLIDVNYHSGYSPDDKPIFFGHYWLKMNTDGPKIQTPNVCCLDYSVAKKGHLVAYRYDGEKVLSNNKFIYVETIQ
jgi:hypothetical protein